MFIHKNIFIKAFYKIIDNQINQNIKVKQNKQLHMRLISHNLLQCNVKGCDKNNFPLIIYVQNSKIIECEYKRDSITKLIPKLDWNALAKTVHCVILIFKPLKNIIIYTAWRK